MVHTDKEQIRELLKGKVEMGFTQAKMAASIKCSSALISQLLAGNWDNISDSM